MKHAPGRCADVAQWQSTEARKLYATLDAMKIEVTIMITVRLVLVLVALACFLLAAFGASFPRVNLVALGLACWVATLLVRT